MRRRQEFQPRKWRHQGIRILRTLSACCARAASGHAAAPTSPVTNSRRLMAGIMAQGPDNVLARPPLPRSAEARRALALPANY